eukprot:9788535-Lingulodinium_polyedra.AAC.1
MRWTPGRPRRRRRPRRWSPPRTPTTPGKSLPGPHMTWTDQWHRVSRSCTLTREGPRGMWRPQMPR